MYILNNNCQDIERQAVKSINPRKMNKSSNCPDHYSLPRETFQATGQRGEIETESSRLPKLRRQTESPKPRQLGCKESDLKPLSCIPEN